MERILNLGESYKYNQSDFNTGEISPRARAKVGTKAYKGGLKKNQNWMAMADGGIVTRPGTIYKRASISTSPTYVRLFPFSGMVATNGAPIQNGFLELSTDGTGRILFKDNTVLNLDFGGGGAMVADGWKYANNDPHPYNSSTKLYRIRTFMSKYGLVLLSPGLPPIRLTSTNGVVFFLSNLISPAIVRDRTSAGKEKLWNGPWLGLNVTSTTMTPAASTGTGILVTASQSVFASTDVGRMIRISNPASAEDWGWGWIVSYVSPTEVTVDIVVDFSTTNATPDWQLGAFSDTTGWPRVGFRFQGRTYFMSTDEEPSGIYASEVGDFGNFIPSDADGTITSSHGFRFVVADHPKPIMWGIPSNNGILFGTSGSGGKEFSINRDGTAIAPDSISIRDESEYGSHEEPDLFESRAIKTGANVLFVETGGKRIRIIDYDFTRDRFSSEDISLYFEHLTESYIFSFVYQKKYKCIWFINAEGELRSITFDPAREMFSVSDHVLGGTGVTIESIAELDNEIWMVVSRTINGSGVRYIEKLADVFSSENGDATEDAVMSDCSYEYSGASTTTITGLSHLEGESVSVLGDGMTFANRTVSGGQITLSVAVSKAKIGLYPNKDIEFLSPDVPLQSGTTMSMDKNIKVAWLRLLDTSHLKIGSRSSKLEDIPFREVGDDMDSPTPLFDGTKEVHIEDEYRFVTGLYIRQDKPLPACILAVEQEVSVA